MLDDGHDWCEKWCMRVNVNNLKLLILEPKVKPQQIFILPSETRALKK